jgi:hypothetical protein
MTIPNLAWELGGIAVAAVVYLVFDTYPVKCFRPTFCRTQAQIGQELNQLQTECAAAGTSFERAIAERIAQTDISHARQLLR